MIRIALYLLEVSAVMAVLYILYLLLLSKETFFNLNRFFLLAIPVFSLLFPLLSFDFLATDSISIINRPVREFSDMRMYYYDVLDTWPDAMQVAPLRAANGQSEEGSGLSHVSLLLWLMAGVYGIGIIVTLVRLVWAYILIYRLKNSHPKEIIRGVAVVKVPHDITPFSFLNSVYVHKGLAVSDEFIQILEHEKTHIRQWHSFDLIFVQLLAVVLWFNPIVWLLIKSLKTTHEYIADKKMINMGYSLVEYQSLLLRQLISNNSHGLVHYFNLSFIKKRIIMMQIEKSGWTGRVKVALGLSMVIVFSLVIVQCNSQMDNGEDLQVPMEEVAASDPLDRSSLPVIQTENSFVIGEGIHADGVIEAHILQISNGIITINANETIEVEQISAKMDGLPPSTTLSVLIDADQPMGLVRKIQMELRKANIRKLLYRAQSEDGKNVILMILLPPAPGPDVPTYDDHYMREHNIEHLPIDLGDNTNTGIHQKVYGFIQEQISVQNTDYVVSARFDDGDTYGEYLTNLHQVFAGFNQVYKERAQAMYGKDWFDLVKERLSNPDSEEMFRAVRQGVPRNISIAED